LCATLIVFLIPCFSGLPVFTQFYLYIFVRTYVVNLMLLACLSALAAEVHVALIIDKLHEVLQIPAVTHFKKILLPFRTSWRDVTVPTTSIGR